MGLFFTFLGEYMKAFLLSLLMISTQAFSATAGYDLKMDLSLNGKHFSSPRLHVQEGVVGSIETTSKDKTGYLQSNYIEVKATEILVSNKKRIKMNFTVGIFDKMGQKVVTSKSNIIARENENVKITLSENEDSTKHLVLSVVAKRKSI